MKIWYIIPARAGSRGFPGKNRVLYPLQIDKIPAPLLESTILTSDDPWFSDQGHCGIYVKRPANLANDTAAIRDVLQHVADTVKASNDDVFVALYLTYPDRPWSAIAKAVEAFISNGDVSMVGVKPPATHPFMCVWPDGTPVCDHRSYRRQDYPAVFEMSHAVCICTVGHLPALNGYMMSHRTRLWNVENWVDVDTEADMRTAGVS